MIIDRIENYDVYFNKESNLYLSFAFILEDFNEGIKDGRFAIKDDDIYALVQSYDTEDRENKRLESHKRYIDIQYIASGKELIEWAPLSELSIMAPYSEEKDVIFYRGSNYLSSLILTSGTFAVFYPGDAHRTGCMLDGPESVRKIVIKVKV